MIGPPGTPANTTIMEQRADELIALVNPHTGTSSATIKSWVTSWRNNLNNNFGTGSSEPLIPDALISSPAIQFGAIDFNPLNGQDAEFIELINPDPNNAIDLTGWTLNGGVDFEFVPGTVIPPGDRAYLSPDRAAFRSRTTGPSGNQGLFVIGNYRGHLNNFGEPLNLFDPATNLISSITYTGQLTQAQQFLVISEIMHNPTNHVDAEYIELLNISHTETLDLSHISFTTGIEFTFPTNTLLAPNARILVVNDLTHFATNLPIAGVFTNDTRLESNGEGLKLEDATGSTIHEFTYRTTAPWPVGGVGLVLIAPYTQPDPGIGSNWRSNAATPGTTDGYLAVTAPDIALAISSPHQLRVPLDLLAENVSVQLQFSPDLLLWNDATSNQALFMHRDPDGTVYWQLLPPVSDPKKFHARLRVTVH